MAELLGIILYISIFSVILIFASDKSQGPLIVIHILSFIPFASWVYSDKGDTYNLIYDIYRLTNKRLSALKGVNKIKIPAFLSESFGYNGHSRFIVVFEEKNNKISVVGNDKKRNNYHNDAYIYFINHESIKPHLSKYMVNNHVKKNDYCLAIDRSHNRLYLIKVQNIDIFINNSFDYIDNSYNSRNCYTKYDNNKHYYNKLVSWLNNK